MFLKKNQITHTKGKNILNQILTHMSDLYDESLHFPPTGRSNHQTLFLPSQIRRNMPHISKKSRQLKPGNLNALGLKTNLEDWEKVYSKSDVDEKVSQLYCPRYV